MFSMHTDPASEEGQSGAFEGVLPIATNITIRPPPQPGKLFAITQSELPAPFLVRHDATK